MSTSQSETVQSDPIRSILRVCIQFLAKEKFEYLRHILTKWADILTSNRGLFIVHLFTRDVAENCFEILTADFNKELQPFKSYKK